MAYVTCEILWLISLHEDLHVIVSLRVNIFCDNNSAIQTAANPVFHERTKHLEIDLHLLENNQC